MVEYFIDTSALVKRYKHKEKGSEVVNSLFTTSEAERIISCLSMVEILNIFYGLLRKNKITNEELQTLLSIFYNDINSGKIRIYGSTEEHAYESEIQIKRAQSLPERDRRERPDPIDILIITGALDFKDLNLIFVSSDLDLNQLAEQENIQVLNPEEKEGEISGCQH
ncbi:MAG: type II toxin-antitoxin system VapC family toxin [Nitrospirota bacterium]